MQATNHEGTRNRKGTKTLQPARPAWTIGLIFACVIGVLFTRPVGTQHSARAHVAPPPVGGKLARAVLLGGAPLTAQDLPADLSSSDRLRLLALLERRADFRSQLGTSAPGAAVADHRVRLEQNIATVIEHTGIEEEAAEIARSAPLSADGPTRAANEASWAESVLSQRPSSPAAPYLYAFLAARYRQIFEQLPDDPSALERQARKYKTMIERVRGADDPIFQLLANDLDGLPSLSPGATRHPQQYLPDT